MTNEEKAREIMLETDCGDYICAPAMTECALKAMQWKDEQSAIKQDTATACIFSFFKLQGNTDEQINNFIAAIETQIEKNMEKYENTNK